jgi:hypothetical protein
MSDSSNLEAVIIDDAMSNIWSCLVSQRWVLRTCVAGSRIDQCVSARAYSGVQGTSDLGLTCDMQH